MKTILLIISALAFASVTRSASLISEAGVAYASISGVRTYSARGTNSSTSSLAIPFIRVSTDLTKNWLLGVSYSYIGNLDGTGLSPDADIFGDKDGFYVQMLTPYNCTEKIHELALDFRYAWQIADRLSFQFGPVASLFSSKATIANRSFSSTEVKFGAVADLRYDLTKKWQLAVGCRYSQPTDRKITQLTLSAAYRL